LLRGPNWLYAALALHAADALFYQFDARLGWVAPPGLRVGVPDQDAPLQAQVIPENDYDRVEFRIPDTYLDYREAGEVAVPPLAGQRGVLVSGRLPHWLLCAIVRCYRDAPWIAVFQPQLAGAVVVHSTEPGGPRVGSWERYRSNPTGGEK
jgi:CRISPR-associated protein Csx3